ncbi:NAC domain-containing protein 41-like [Alnus glutinosa]|uniref:NAC domain-containing protein 41-like n=1 Tax=Alnus glutinosa TaxID=3517 RepID=UPI002D777A96|nr:NAC domain-containing protein 41-like [Alnus glutinosa]
MGAMLPLGFRFKPTDEELISHYLVNKVKGEQLSWDGIPDCDLYGEKPPWEICGDKDEKAYFFTELKKLSKNRVARTTGCGVWHENCTVKIYDNRGDIIGARKLFNFNVKEGSTTKNSNWIMHEFSLVGEQQGTNCVLYTLQKKGSESSSGVKRRYEEGSHQRKRVCCDIVECLSPQAILIPAETDMETNMGCLPSSDHSDFNFDLETIMSMQPPEVGDLPILSPLEDFWDADCDALFAWRL